MPYQCSFVNFSLSFEVFPMKIARLIVRESIVSLCLSLWYLFPIERTRSRIRRIKQDMQALIEKRVVTHALDLAGSNQNSHSGATDGREKWLSSIRDIRFYSVLKG